MTEKKSTETAKPAEAQDTLTYSQPKQVEDGTYLHATDADGNTLSVTAASEEEARTHLQAAFTRLKTK